MKNPILILVLNLSFAISCSKNQRNDFLEAEGAHGVSAEGRVSQTATGGNEPNNTDAAVKYVYAQNQRNTPETVYPESFRQIIGNEAPIPTEDTFDHLDYKNLPNEDQHPDKELKELSLDRSQYLKEWIQMHVNNSPNNYNLSNSIFNMTRSIIKKLDIQISKLWMGLNLGYKIEDDLNFISVHKLDPDSALRKQADRVGRVLISNGGLQLGSKVSRNSCSGTLISPSLVLFNNHCLSPTKGVKHKVQVDFSHEIMKKDNQSLAITNSEIYECSNIVFRDAVLDIAVVKCVGEPGNQKDRGWAVLSDEPLLDGKRVYTIGHPSVGHSKLKLKDQLELDIKPLGHQGPVDKVKRISFGQVNYKFLFETVPTEMPFVMHTAEGGSGSLVYSEDSHRAVALFRAVGKVTFDVGNKEYYFVSRAHTMEYVLGALKAALGAKLSEQKSVYGDLAQIPTHVKDRGLIRELHQVELETSKLEGVVGPKHSSISEVQIENSFVGTDNSNPALQELSQTISFMKNIGSYKVPSTLGYQETNYFYQYCTGTHIAPDVILTAAHCIEHNFKKAQLYYNYLETNTQMLNVVGGHVYKVQIKDLHSRSNLECQKVLAFDRSFDMAFLYCPQNKDQKYVRIAPSKIKHNDFVYSLHHAKGEHLKITANKVEASAQVDQKYSSYYPATDFLVRMFDPRDTDEDVSGASGAAILNAKHEVVGVLSGSRKFAPSRRAGEESILDETQLADYDPRKHDIRIGFNSIHDGLEKFVKVQNRPLYDHLKSIHDF